LSSSENKLEMKSLKKGVWAQKQEKKKNKGKLVWSE